MDGDANGTEIVDIGADEYYWPQADYNTDEIVNFLDYSFLAQNWLDINSAISLDDDNDVDTYDLDSFCVDWLWQAPWGNNFLFMRMAGGGGHMLTKSLTADYSIAVSPRTSAIGLMIPDVTTSLESMPDSTYEKVGKFYKADAYEQAYISPRQRAALIADMIDWLDELWESGEVGDMTYQDYIEFREAIKSSFRIALPRGRN
jgi:hypothetical protein